jgi:hypothetical protein
VASSDCWSLICASKRSWPLATAALAIFYRATFSLLLALRPPHYAAEILFGVAPA